MSNELAFRIPFLRKRNGRIAAEELREKGGTGEPLPVADVARGLVVDESFLKDLGAALPVNVAPSPRKEAGDGVPTEVVEPTFVT